MQSCGRAGVIVASLGLGLGLATGPAAAEDPVFIGLGDDGGLFRFGFSGAVERVGHLEVPVPTGILGIVTGLTLTEDGRWFAINTFTGNLIEFAEPGTFSIVRPPVVPQFSAEFANYSMLADSASSRLYQARQNWLHPARVNQIAVADLDSRTPLYTINLTNRNTFTGMSLDGAGRLLLLTKSGTNASQSMVLTVNPVTGAELGTVMLPNSLSATWGLREVDGKWYYMNGGTLVEFDPVARVVTRSRAIVGPALDEVIVELEVEPAVVINAVTGEPEPQPPQRCGPLDISTTHGSYGVLDTNDVLTYAFDFVAGRPSADIALPSFTLDMHDVMTFVTIYDDGCPD